MSKLKPYYKQIADELEHDIMINKYRAGARMPTEKALQERFFVSRMTVRQAYRLLVKKGVAVMVKNKGIFVADVTIQKNLEPLSFNKIISEKGLANIDKIVKFERGLPSAKAREALQLADKEEVYLLHRYRYVQGELVLVEKANIVAKFVPGFEKHDFEKNSLYDTLFYEYGLELDEIKDDIYAGYITGEIAQLMMEKERGPALLINATTYLKSGVPIEYTEQICNHKVFTYHIVRKGIFAGYSREDED